MSLILSKTHLQMNQESQHKTWLSKAVGGKHMKYTTTYHIGNDFLSKIEVGQGVQPAIFNRDAMRLKSFWQTSEEADQRMEENLC